MVQQLLREAGVSGRITEKPLARGLLDAKTRPRTCVIGMARSPAVDADYVWFGPLARTRMVVLSRPGSTLTLRGAEELRAQLLVVARGSLPDQWVIERQLAATRVADNTAAYRMLLRRHADFWVVNELLAQRLVREAGGAPLSLALVVQSLDNHLACHPGLPPELQARLTQAVAALKAQGTLKPFGVE